METGEKELRELEKSTANAHGSFSLGLFATALWLCSVSEDSRWIIFVVIGAIFALSSLYFLFIHKGNRQKIINVASFVRVNYIVWFLGLVLLGVGLIQTRLNWAALPGVICIYAGYTVLIVGIIKALKELIFRKS
jgi:hypothetical protein